MEPGTDQERRRRFRLRRSGKRGAWALRNWRVRTRLLAVILIPITAAVLLGGLRLGSAVQDANEYERVRTLTRLAEHTTALAHDLENERDLAAVYIASDRNIDPAQLNAQRASVDQAVVLFRAQAQDIDSSYGPLVNSKLTAVSHQLATLDALRDSALTSKLPALAAINAYSAVISALLSVDVEIAGDANSRALSEKSRALDAFSRAKDSASRQRAILGAVLTSGRFQPDELESFLFADEQQASALLDFDAVAQPAQQAMFEDTVTGTDIDKAELTKQLAIARQTTSTGRLAADARLKPDEWFSAMTNKLDLMRVVEARLVDGLLTQSADLQGAAQRSALLVSVLVLLILVFALGATLAVAQSMVGPLQILRSSALDVAGRRLPEVVRVLRDSDGSRLDDIKVERTSIDSTDEIGEVARAFDEVHSEAVRLATEQALLRSSVNAMFVNLSRRSQSLVERQLRLIDDLENAEQDPDQLSSLFKLDHLATRMRRNGENLLVLAGEEAGRRWSAPVPLLDVIRASTSEVEQYERVQLRGLPMADVAGRAVNDVVHLIAELLENATAYSSPETKVLVTSQLLNGGGAMIEIEDRGIGMTAKELEDANFRLQNPPVVDVSVARRMGLFVVGRLAGRHGIRVQLRKSSSGGITALVMLPEQLVLDHSGDAAAQPGQARQPSLFDSESKGAQAARPPVPAAGQPGQSRPVTPGAGSQPGSVPAVRPSAPSSPVPYNGAPAEPPATLPPFGPVSQPPAKPPTARLPRSAHWSPAPRVGTHRKPRRPTTSGPGQEATGRSRAATTASARRSPVPSWILTPATTVRTPVVASVVPPAATPAMTRAARSSSHRASAHPRSRRAQSRRPRPGQPSPDRYSPGRRSASRSRPNRRTPPSRSPNRPDPSRCDPRRLARTPAATPAATPATTLATTPATDTPRTNRSTWARTLRPRAVSWCPARRTRRRR
jgi:signal transduction histidine kinase